jgi:hypothetical protein
MYGHVTSGRPPLSEPIDAVLGHQLSPMAGQFMAEYADFLTRVDFKDIEEHPLTYIRSVEAHSSCDGQRHTIWLDTKNPNFEPLMMHQAMRGILMERGFPRTTCPAGVTLDDRLLYLGSLLSSAVTDPIIDRWLIKGGYTVYDRALLGQRTMEQVWLDSRVKDPKPYGFIFCKWTLLAVLMKLDATFDGQAVNLLHALIRKKFPEPWELGERLSTFILKKGFAEPFSALIAMLQIRNALKLEDKVPIVDAEGIRF